MVAIAPSRFNLTLLALALAGVVALSLAVSRAMSVSAPAVQVSAARLANGTEGLLRQTAAHLSKMQRGASVGGFPGFEPPDDDEKYRRRIKEQHLTAQDVNDWVKEINNFLRQIIKNNPRMSLEEILQKQGLTPSQTENLLDALRDTEVTARGMQNYGVAPETAATLRTLLETLGVALWL
ncbi:MAG: hypothetical protein HY327_09065 [Chloroflexi bacterium]|nr:hypothetical protein [Chloroflexota bacterium]